MVKINVRKLIGFGKNSYVVSLPKQWVEKNKLNKGDLISIDENKEGLLLKTNNVELKKEEPKTIWIIMILLRLYLKILKQTHQK